MDPKKKDYYYRLAKKRGFVARSAFKLEALDQKYRLFNQGYRVLDLGAAPGSWVQYVAPIVKERGLIVAIDLMPIELPFIDYVKCIQEDIEVYPFHSLVSEHGRFHVVISDVAPQTTGQREADHDASLKLCNRVFDIALESLKSGGSFVCKMYQGEGTKGFLDRLKPHFNLAKVQKPGASRSESREVFLVGIKFKR
ncbi:MAG: RlmE family RNA methyltransferase [Bdellovibrionales bacterium]|nr:RlmE family RNA methyltransferase [Bdellovibrionales bacterium]